jgi:hypothetical protein
MPLEKTQVFGFASKWRSSGRSLLPMMVAIVFSLLYSLLAGVSGVPARLEEIAYFTKEGYRFHEYLFSAFLRDINVNLIFFTVFWLVIWGVCKLRVRWGQKRLSGRLSFLLIFGFAVFFGLMEFMGAEFRVERGIYPSWFDVRNSTGGSAVGLAYFKLAFSSSVLIGWLATLLGSAVLAAYVSRAQTHLLRWSSLLISLFVLGLISDQIRWVWVKTSRALPSIMNASVTDSPFAGFVRKSRGRTVTNSFYGVSGLLRGLETKDVRTAREGLQLLGLDPGSVERLQRCDTGMHPLREELFSPAGGGEASRKLTHAIHELSSALFEKSSRPVHLHQILMETFLSADFSSLGGALPEETIPFWNELNKRSRQPDSATVVTSDLRQAGVRTSQAVSASFCGLGTLPHLLSMGRDLQEIPLRCMPEVLKDAGFHSEMHHGYRPEFDLRTQFFEARQMDFWHIRRIPGALSGATAFWDGDIGLSDRKLFDFSLARAAELPESQSTYTGVLTLSSHRPFKVPNDIKPEDAVAADRILQGLGEQVTSRPLTKDRIRILRYVDSALRDYIEGLARLPKTSRSITMVIAYGDHSHSEADLFASPGSRTPTSHLAILSRIPFFLHVFPESLKDHPERARVLRALAGLNQVLQETPLSQNDIPRLILGLLFKSPELKGLPRDKRWHTLGGQVLSPFSAPPAAQPSGLVWGVDGSSEAFVIDSRGQPLLREGQGPLDGPESFERAGAFGPVNQALALMIRYTKDLCLASGGP